MINESILLVAVGVMNLTNTITNIVYIAMSKRMQINKDLLSELTEQSKAKNEVIKDLKQSKKVYKRQFENLLIRHKELEGRYKQLNNEPMRIINQSLIEETPAYVEANQTN